MIAPPLHDVPTGTRAGWACYRKAVPLATAGPPSCTWPRYGSCGGIRRASKSRGYQAATDVAVPGAGAAQKCGYPRLFDALLPPMRAGIMPRQRPPLAGFCPLHRADYSALRPSAPLRRASSASIAASSSGKARRAAAAPARRVDRRPRRRARPGSVRWGCGSAVCGPPARRR